MKKLTILMITLTVVLFLSACDTEPLSASLTVKYEITGTAEKVNIDYIDSNGELVIINNISLPWELTFSANQGDSVFLSAKRTGTTGTVTVIIYKDGTVLDEATSSDGTTAEVDGTL